MLRNRVIPMVLLENGRVVKTERFRDPKYVGDPINTVRIFNEKHVDEIVILDIGASRGRLSPDFKLLRRIVGEAFMPVTYGGGITSLDHAKKLVDLGIEKVSVRSGAFKNPALLPALSGFLGAQSVVAALDLESPANGRTKILCGPRKKLKDDKLELLLNRWMSDGVGELLMTNASREGTFRGPDVSLIRRVADLVSIPLVAAGGVAGLADIERIFQSGATGAGVGSYFLFQQPHRAVLITYPSEKDLERLCGGGPSREEVSLDPS